MQQNLSARGAYANTNVGQPASAHQSTSSLLHQSFKNPNWPPNFINADNVLDYFCDPGNAFYDPSSCNQHVKMQNLNRPLHECLQSMQGIQFTVVGANHPLYLIMKQRRNSPNNVTPLCYYYVVNGTVYQCPDIYTFVQSKLIGAVEPLRHALEQARQFCRYNVAKGYFWEFKDSADEVVKTEEKEDEKPLTARSTNFQRTRTDELLKLLFDKFPPPENVEFDFGNNELPQGDNPQSRRAESADSGEPQHSGNDVTLNSVHVLNNSASSSHQGSQPGAGRVNLSEQQHNNEDMDKRFKIN
ncbi:hypothetical protein AB6A40_002433 [Gnathostoma spinigerum]|uniref:Mediator of RNA polymerase II transcription subunit 6 n=1 Tax=Gnathostoma spinigerum TaxID=75299 RepID=A0ABD6EEE0_9BILA